MYAPCGGMVGADMLRPRTSNARPYNANGKRLQILAAPFFPSHPLPRELSQRESLRDVGVAKRPSGSE